MFIIISKRCYLFVWVYFPCYIHYHDGPALVVHSFFNRRYSTTNERTFLYTKLPGRTGLDWTRDTSHNMKNETFICFSFSSLLLSTRPSIRYYNERRNSQRCAGLLNNDFLIPFLDERRNIYNNIIWGKEGADNSKVWEAGISPRRSIFNRHPFTLLFSFIIIKDTYLNGHRLVERFDPPGFFTSSLSSLHHHYLFIFWFLFISLSLSTSLSISFSLYRLYTEDCHC